MPTRILIADDHPTYLRTLATILRSADLEIVGTASAGTDAVRLSLELQPDVVLMDVRMPGIDGIEATARIVEAAPHIAVVVLTMFDEDDSVIAAMQSGARGYLVKGAPKEEILRAVEGCARGEAIFGATVARRLPSYFARGAAESVPFPTLTGREREILGHVADGMDSHDIARRLVLSEKTIRNYLSSIYTKLDVSSRAEAIVAARNAGLGA